MLDCCLALVGFAPFVHKAHLHYANMPRSTWTYDVPRTKHQNLLSVDTPALKPDQNCILEGASSHPSISILPRQIPHVASGGLSPSPET